MTTEPIKFDDIQNPAQSEGFTKDETPAIGEPPEETVGDIMKASTARAIKAWLIFVSIVVYTAGIVYAEVHGLTMLQKGVAPDMRIWAQMGMIAAGVSALALPAVLKVWTVEAKQRIGAYIFYALDFAFLIFNAFTDFNTQQGQTLAPWAQSYVTYILPASPIIVALCWAVVWELDPHVKKVVMLQSLRAAMQEKLMHRVAEAAKGAHVTTAVNQAANREVDRALTELFGTPVQGYVMDGNDLPQRRGLVSSFFGSLSSLLSRAVSAAMDSRSNSRNSDKPQG